MWLYVLLVLVFLAVVGLAIVIFIDKQKKPVIISAEERKQYEFIVSQLSDAQNHWEELLARNNELAQVINEQQLTITQHEQEIIQKNNELTGLQTLLSERQELLTIAQEEYKRLTEQKEQKQGELEAEQERCRMMRENLEAEQSQFITTLHRRRTDAEEENAKILQKCGEIQSKYSELLTAMREAEVQKAKLEKEIAGIKDAITTMQLHKTSAEEELQTLKTQHRQTLRAIEGDYDIREMIITTDDCDRYKLLLQVKERIPSIAPDIAKLIWSSIWQDYFQAMTVDLLKTPKCGIYCIYTEHDGQIKRYIGQAKDIRDRWSQHIKAVLGVKSEPNKFHNSVKVEDLHFIILEECKQQDLNRRESYYIELFDTVAQGYNTRT